MSDRIVIGWHRILWQMVRHCCGPNRAVDHELARRYDKKMARVRDAWLREHNRDKRTPVQQAAGEGIRTRDQGGWTIVDGEDALRLARAVAEHRAELMDRLSD